MNKTIYEEIEELEETRKSLIRRALELVEYDRDKECKEVIREVVKLSMKKRKLEGKNTTPIYITDERNTKENATKYLERSRKYSNEERENRTLYKLYENLRKDSKKNK